MRYLVIHFLKKLNQNFFIDHLLLGFIFLIVGMNFIAINMCGFFLNAMILLKKGVISVFLANTLGLGKEMDTHIVLMIKIAASFVSLTPTGVLLFLAFEDKPFTEKQLITLLFGLFSVCVATVLGSYTTNNFVFENMPQWSVLVALYFGSVVFVLLVLIKNKKSVFKLLSRFKTPVKSVSDAMRKSKSIIADEKENELQLKAASVLKDRYKEVITKKKRKAL